ncbi:hypothetical protein SCA6_014513 [Theobroma cacao]
MGLPETDRGKLHTKNCIRGKSLLLPVAAVDSRSESVVVTNMTCFKAVVRAVVGDKEHTFVPCRYFHGHGNWILIGRCQSFINSRASSQLMMTSRIPSGYFSLYNAASKFCLYKP